MLQNAPGVFRIRGLSPNAVAHNTHRPVSKTVDFKIPAQLECFRSSSHESVDAHGQQKASALVVDECRSDQISEQLPETSAKS
jgi:hypothetical protein